MDDIEIRKDMMVGPEHRESREGLEGEDEEEVRGKECCGCIQMLDGQWQEDTHTHTRTHTLPLCLW